MIDIVWTRKSFGVLNIQFYIFIKHNSDHICDQIKIFLPANKLLHARLPRNTRPNSLPWVRVQTANELPSLVTTDQ